MQLYHSSTPLTGAFVVELIGEQSTYSSTQPGDAPAYGEEETHTTRVLLDQVAQSLIALEYASDALIEGSSHGLSFDLELQPHARRAEVAMHKLRHLSIAHHPAAFELSQSLTVIVLISDMVAAGQIIGPAASESYALLRRNTRRAAECLRMLYRSLPE